MKNAHGVSLDGARQVGAVLVAVVVIGVAAPRVWGASGGLLRVEAGPQGEIEVDARGVPIEEVLQAVSAAGGIEIAIKDGIKRAPVYVTVPMAPVEDVLREILHDRNYALIYDAETGSPSQVFVLAPSGPRSSSAPVRRAPRTTAARRAKGKAKGPTIVRF